MKTRDCLICFVHGCRWNNFESDTKICKEDQNLYTLIFSVFLLKTTAGLSSLCLEVEVKINSQHVVKNLAEK